MKKVLALVLVAVLSIGMMVTSFAATPRLTLRAVGLGGSFTNGNVVTPVAIDDMVVRAEGYVAFALAPVVTAGNNAAGTAYAVNEANAKDSKITIQRVISSGSGAIRDIDYWTSGGVTYVRVRFLKEHISTKEIKFSIKLYLAQDGKREEGTLVELNGKLENPITDVNEGEDYIDLSNKYVAEAKDYINGIEVYGGNGVSLKDVKLFDGKKYYFTTNMDITTDQEAVLAKYPEIDAIYNLNQAGFSFGSGSKVVKFDMSDKYYAYNAEGEYIGTTAELLPFSKTIYLAGKKIDMIGTGTASEAPESSSAPTNNNQNPNTGVNGFANIAVVAGVVALAAAGAVAFKK